MVGQGFKLKTILIQNPGFFLSHHGQKLLERMSEVSSRKFPLLLLFLARPCISRGKKDVEETQTPGVKWVSGAL